MSPRIATSLVFAAWICGAWLASSLPAALASADPSLTEAPAKGRYLVATRQIRGNVFEKSVVFLTDYGAGRAMGLIVNLPTDKPLGELFEGVPERAGRLHVGGPVDSQYMMVLMRSDSAPRLGQQIVGDIYLTGDEGVLREAAAAPGAAASMRVFAGYAGWSAGQLDREIARGDWLVVESPGALFDASPGSLWKKLFESHRRLIAAPSGKNVRHSIDRG